MIKPGQRERLEVSNTSSAQFKDTGETGAYLTVSTNDAAHPQITLRARARVLHAIRFYPEPKHYAYILFDRVSRTAEAQSQVVTLRRGDGGPLRPRVGAVDVPNVTAELREVEAGERYELKITVSPPWPNAQIWGEVTLETGVPEYPTQAIRVNAMIDPRLKADPAWFSMPTHRDETMVLRASLAWSDDMPAGRALAVSVVPEQITATIEVDDGRQVVVLTIPPDCPPPSRDCQYAVTVTTDDQAVPELRIPIQLSYRPANYKPFPDIQPRVP